MTEEKIKNLLQKVDQMAACPIPVPINIAASVRRRANQKRLQNIIAPLSVAAMLVIAAGIWGLTTRTTKTIEDKNKIVSLELQVQQLQDRIDATLKLTQKVLEYEQQQSRLNELEAKLASIPDSLEETRAEVDKTAFILLYQADRMYRERNQRASAVQTYKRIIELFPQSPSAETARQRLAEIPPKPVNLKDLKT